MNVLGPNIYSVASAGNCFTRGHSFSLKLVKVLIGINFLIYTYLEDRLIEDPLNTLFYICGTRAWSNPRSGEESGCFYRIKY